MSAKMHYGPSGRTFPLEMAQRCVGPGWAGLVAECYELLPDGSTISQVKEKFGGLRFYADPYLDAINDIEDRSLTVCEDCGQPGEPRSGGWIRTLCDGCAG